VIRRDVPVRDGGWDELACTAGGRDPWDRWMDEGQLGSAWAGKYAWDTDTPYCKYLGRQGGGTELLRPDWG